MNRFLQSRYFWVAAFALLILSFAFGPAHFGVMAMFALGLVTTQRSTNEAISETVLVRDVPDEVMVLDGDITPLTVMSVDKHGFRNGFVGGSLCGD